MENYLTAESMIDSDDPRIRSFAGQIVADIKDPVEKAIRLYLAVRDRIRYDPYYPFHRPEFYRAGYVLEAGRAFCIPKVALLCAAARASGIPARPGFATVRNHLATRQLLEFIGSDIFTYHGYAELYLEGKWVKATPAFNRELCERHGVEPLEFTGREDSIFQAFSSDGKKFMEYLEFHGTFSDIPVDRIVEAFKTTYGRDRVRGWIENFERYGDVRGNLFRK